METKNLNSSKIVLIGCGNMGGAIAEGIVKRGEDYSLTLIDAEFTKAEELSKALDSSGKKVSAAKSIPYYDGRFPRVFILAVKPTQIADTIKEYLPKPIQQRDIVISVAAGVSTTELKKSLTAELPDGLHVNNDTLNVVRAMPNLCAAIGHSLTGIYCSKPIPQLAISIFECIGKVVTISKEETFPAYTAIAGSLPAFIFVALEAIADAAVLLGLPREASREIAAETLIGSAIYARESELHTAELKDRVSSPGGTTIAGLATLEEKNFRHTLIDAIVKTARRAQDMEENKR